MGKLSALQVLEYATGADLQGASGLTRLASIGSDHAFRSLKNVFGIPVGAPDFTWLEIPTIAGPKTVHPFLMPHKFFASYFAAHDDKWAQSMSGPVGACLQFWTEMQETAFVLRHPALPRSTWPSMVPFGFHGDAGAFSHHDSLYTISWNSPVGRGTTSQKKFVFTVFRKSEMVADTLNTIFRILAWSFNILLTGKWPLRNWHGRREPKSGQWLANGWRAAVCQVRGDWAFYTEVFHFPQWNGAERMCWLCRASSTIPHLHFGRFGDDAGWRGTRWTHESYMDFLRGAGLAIPVLFLCVIGLRLECIMVDTLHTVDQGVACHIIANIFWILVINRRVLGGDTQEDAIQGLQKYLKEWYKGSGFTGSKVQGKLTIDRIRTRGGWPKLKAKAAATRHLAKFALHLVLTFADGDPRLIAICQLLCSFDDTLDEESMFLSPPCQDRVAQNWAEIGDAVFILVRSSCCCHGEALEDEPKAPSV